MFDLCPVLMGNVFEKGRGGGAWILLRGCLSPLKDIVKDIHSKKLHAFDMVVLRTSGLAALPHIHPVPAQLSACKALVLLEHAIWAREVCLPKQSNPE